MSATGTTTGTPVTERGHFHGGARVRLGIPLLLILLPVPGNSAPLALPAPLIGRDIPRETELRIELSGNSVEFVQLGRPGLLAPQQELSLRVTSLQPRWSVSVATTPLTCDPSTEHFIPPSRLFVRSDCTGSAPDRGGGPGFVSLEQPVVVANAVQHCSETPLAFRLRTQWDDTPGIYHGEIHFTALVQP